MAEVLHRSHGVIYLDHNVICDVVGNRRPRLGECLTLMRERGFLFPYSPAHMEEIANIYHHLDDPAAIDHYINENLRCIHDLSCGLEILPGFCPDGPTRFTVESVHDCIGRVLDKYKNTVRAESNEEFLRDLLGDGSSLVPPDNVFTRPELRDLLLTKLSNQGVDIEALPRGVELRGNHRLLQGTVDALFRVLSEAGYCREPKKKTRSAIHDVTHAIYATKADLLITGDDKFYHKVKAVYKFLEAETEIVRIEDFNIDAMLQRLGVA